MEFACSIGVCVCSLHKLRFTMTVQRQGIWGIDKLAININEGLNVYFFLGF